MKISNYPEVEALNEDDLLVISRPGQGTKSVSIAALARLLAAGIGNAVANNLNVTEEGYILDARQGKVLKDLHDSRIKVLYDGAAANGSIINLTDTVSKYTILLMAPRWSNALATVNSSIIPVSRFKQGGYLQADFYDGGNRHFVCMYYNTESAARIVIYGSGFTGGVFLLGLK